MLKRSYGIRAMDGRCMSFISLQLISYLEHILLYSHYLLLVSVGQPQDLLANHSFALVSQFLLVDGQALFGWSCNGVS